MREELRPGLDKVPDSRLVIDVATSVVEKSRNIAMADGARFLFSYDGSAGAA